MQHKRGFSLLSFLLYLVLFSVVTLCMCHVITMLIIPAFSSLRRTQSIIALHVATDVFARDMQNIKNSVDTWNVMLPHELIWQQDDHNIGWRFHQDRLERREGVYKKGWQESKKSIIARGVLSAVFTIERGDEGIMGVELTITPHCAKKKVIACYVSLRKAQHEEKQ